MMPNEMRVPALAPSQLNAEQKQVYDEAYGICQKMLGDRFAWKDDHEALIGPLSSLMYSPPLARLYLSFAAELGRASTLVQFTQEAREVAILATGAAFSSSYELYAHERIALTTSLSAVQIDLIKQGRKPTGEIALNSQCELAFDVATELTAHNRGPLSDETWRRAESMLGRTATLILVQYVALYSYTCILLNAVNEPVPS